MVSDKKESETETDNPRLILISNVFPHSPSREPIPSSPSPREVYPSQPEKNVFDAEEYAADKRRHLWNGPGYDPRGGAGPPKPATTRREGRSADDHVPEGVPRRPDHEGCRPIGPLL